MFTISFQITIEMFWRIFSSSCVIFIILTSTLLVQSKDSTPPSCFCSLYGSRLEDCPCTADTVDSFNNRINPKLVRLLERDYFRYFQVDFNSACKRGWDLQCSSPNCAVEPCDLDTLPESLRDGRQILTRPGDGGETGLLGRLLHWLFQIFPYLEHLFGYEPDSSSSRKTGCSDPHPEYHDVVKFCKLDPLSAEEVCDSVDLIQNPEQFTGYSGASAHLVWNTIYNELCFHPEENEKTLYLTANTAKKMCVEKRSFYKVVSGLHSSISVHLCSNYLLESSGDKAVWGRNYQEFNKRFLSEASEGEGGDRLSNIYYLYLVELRAVAKVASILKDIDIKEDQITETLLSDILQDIEEFPDHFEEDKLFQEDNMENEELLKMFQDNFMKISELMDCVGCQRCKVWGKLQVTGIGTALKILFTSREELTLTRHEIVALFNALGRHSTSLRELEHFLEKVK